MRHLILLSLFLTNISVYAQKKVLLEAGTIVPVISEVSINARDLTEGQNIHLVTARDVYAETSEVAIPKGSLVLARVCTAKRSRLAGTKGRLTIDIREVSLPNGQTIELCDGTIYFTGKNLTAVVSTAAALISGPLIFISGTKAVLPANYEMWPKVEVSKYIILKDN